MPKEIWTIESLEVTNLLQQLSESSEELNTYTTALNENVARLEERLNDINLGVSTGVEFKCKSANFPGIHKLSYRRTGIKWGFTVDSMSLKQLWPFREAPRELRVASVEHIPELLKKLKTDSYALAEDLKAKVSFLRDITAMLKEPGSVEK
jgi:hypothetical protein